MTLPSMGAKQFSGLLADLGACCDARRWAKGKSLAEVLRTCKRADWILWVLMRQAGEPGWPTHRQVILITCAVVKPAMQKAPAHESRPRTALAAAELLVKSPTEARCQTARFAANAAFLAASKIQEEAAHAAAQAAGEVAWSAVQATELGMGSACSVWLAPSAARAALWAALACDKTHRRMCQIIRRELKELKDK